MEFCPETWMPVDTGFAHHHSGTTVADGRSSTAVALSKNGDVNAVLEMIEALAQGFEEEEERFAFEHPDLPELPPLNEDHEGLGTVVYDWVSKPRGSLSRDNLDLLDQVVRDEQRAADTAGAALALFQAFLPQARSVQALSRLAMRAKIWDETTQFISLHTLGTCALPGRVPMHRLPMLMIRHHYKTSYESLNREEMRILAKFVHRPHGFETVEDILNGYSHKMQALLVWKKMRMGQIKARRWNEEQKAKALEDGGAEESEESNADMMMVD